MGWVTRWVRGGWRPSKDPAREPVVPPVSVSAIYVHPPGSFEREYPRVGDLKYGRENNPTVLGFEEALASLEEGRWALAFNSGMAALSTLVFYEIARGARRILLERLTYGSTRSLLEMVSSITGVEVRLAGPPWESLLDLVCWSDLVIVESMANPTLRVPPLSEVYGEARSCGARVVVDNTFATPVAYRPLEGGARYSLESLTKYISGHNDVVGGSISGGFDDDLEPLWNMRKIMGTIMQPIDAYLAWRGMKTLKPRFEAQSKAALEVAEWLESREKVKRVYYPGLPSHPDHELARKELNGLYGAVVSFEIGGGRGEVFRLLSRLKLVTPSPSFGGVETIISYPAISSHSNLDPVERAELGITEGLLRLSVGLEDVADVISDLSQALSAI
ncbi:aminotransferase class I/II-fold pyridoxal phosphate-dependent enzyme [Aeropyrum camini]|uniref:Cystathionine gamma-synthase n=2 Tax=Aeropyrum camini TaxID=229980 RepID=U3TFJ8_9CREN|nr:aminotransferase class I/II-fold pyridoxal phosphate-dependent enzyme [Aeropyrum camini]BAN90758.1 cystathionine gamma-synthase [Aeropyrum camini SY1 = JCM 12091]